MTIKELLSILPANYEEHSIANTVYNTQWHDHDGTDISIEILKNWQYEVRHTGNTITFGNTDDLLSYITND